MKKLLIAAAAALACVACGNRQNTANGTSDNTADGQTTGDVRTAAQGLNVAYIQMDSLLLKYTLAEELRAAYEAKINKADRELNAKGQKLERDMMDAQEKIQKGLVTRATAEEMQQKLYNQQNELMASRDRIMGELAEEEQVMNNRIYYAIMDYLEEFNADRKYSMIVSTTATGPILNADPALDITAEVLEALNARYAADKKAE